MDFYCNEKFVYLASTLSVVIEKPPDHFSSYGEKIGRHLLYCLLGEGISATGDGVVAGLLRDALAINDDFAGHFLR